MDLKEQLSQDGTDAAGQLRRSTQDHPATGDARKRDDPEEIAEVLGGGSEQPEAAVGAPADEGAERVGSNTDEMADVLRELQRENAQLREREEVPTASSVGALVENEGERTGANKDEVDEVLRELQRENGLLRQHEKKATAVSDAELLQQLEKENFELRLERDAEQIQTSSGGDQAVLVASLLAIVAKLEEDTRTGAGTPSPPAPEAVPAPDAALPSQQGRGVRGKKSLGSPIPLSNWSGASGGVRRRSPQTTHRRVASPVKPPAAAARVEGDEDLPSRGRRSGSSRRLNRRDRRRKSHVKPQRSAAAAAKSAAASRRVARRRKNEWLAWPEVGTAAGPGGIADSSQITDLAGDSGMLAATSCPLTQVDITRVRPMCLRRRADRRRRWWRGQQPTRSSRSNSSYPCWFRPSICDFQPVCCCGAEQRCHRRGYT